MSDKILPLKLTHEDSRDAFLFNKFCESRHQRKTELYFGFLVGTGLILGTINNHISYWKMVKISSHGNMVLGNMMF